MPKEIRITRGLDSMGALRSDGSGSVLKGKRKGDLLTAIKLLPVTINPKSPAFTHFDVAAEQLKRINLEPNPNLVKVLYHGISEVGSHPFIETEFIEGPDLQELLEPPYDRVFTLFEVLKVADHLANALAQAHQVGVVHGNIKPSNIKFDMETADYVLVGFGLSTLTAKQLQSIKLDDAFLAPEQKGGKLSFQADVYSFGMIIYQLLAGAPPFLRFETTERGSSSKAALNVLLDTRKEHLPAGWSQEQREKEMEVPSWLLEVLARCLQVNPQDRFADGIELQDTLVAHSALLTEGDSATPAILLQQENDRLRSLIIHNKELAAHKEEEVARLKAIINHREEQLNALKYQMGTILPENSGISLAKVFLVVLLVGVLGAAGTYFYLQEQENNRNAMLTYTEPEQPSDSNVSNNVLSTSTELKPETTAEKEDLMPAPPKETPEKPAARVAEPIKKQEEPKRQVQRPVERRQEFRAERKAPEPEPEETVYEPEPVPYRPKYTLSSSQAFFYSRPEEAARRNLVLIPSDNTELVAVEDSNGFIYVSFFDAEGKSVRGWLRKQDLRRLN